MNSTPKKTMLMLAGIVLFGGGLGTATAAVTNLAYWRGGENDVPAYPDTFGPANSTVVDGTGNGYSLTKTNTNGDGPYYVKPGGLPAGSTVDYDFDSDGANAFYRDTCVPTPGLTNWGVQLYVKPNLRGGLTNQAYIKNGGNEEGAFSLFQYQGLESGYEGMQYCAEVAGRFDIASGVVVDTNAWVILL